QLWLGVLILAPFQWLYGFGVRWWLPLVISATMLVFVTTPMMSDCRNLAPPSGKRYRVIEGVSGPRISIANPLSSDGATRFTAYARQCTIEVEAAPGESTMRIVWTLTDAFWLAIRYH